MSRARAALALAAATLAALVVALAALAATPASGSAAPAATGAVSTVAAAGGRGASVSSSGSGVQELATTSCVACHGDADLFDASEVQIVRDFERDVHASVGLSCHDCHGGNPDPALADDYVGAKDEERPVGAYRGVPEGPASVPVFCGSCHSDPSYMRRYDPAVRVDQVTEYWSSQHGTALAAGATDVATCTSCHGVHGMRSADEPASRVYPSNVADTCAECHADADRMSRHVDATGAPMPIDQKARWEQSVHAVAMLERGDLSAPTCNDCHGNHGAAPPGLDAVTFVCGQCHAREAELFRTSPKANGFAEHDEMLAEFPGEGCAACHESPEPQAEIGDIRGFGECAACHGNHGVVRPTVAMLGPLPDTPCVLCHETDGLVPEAHDRVGASHYEEARDALLQESAGMLPETRFDWLVDRARALPQHTLSSDAGVVVPRPEFRRLFEKFRIGKTTYGFEDPATGEMVRAPIRRCESCHAGEEILGEDAIGLRVAAELIAQIRTLTVRTAQAERRLLRARRGGVETRAALEAIDGAIDARIGLDVLLHGFRADGEFATRSEEGIAHADAALAAGAGALDELATRRRGLALSLVVIIAVLAGLAVKIRQIDAEAATRETGERS